MIPLATTTITVLRPSPGADIDPYVVSDDAADTEVVTGVPAHISTPSGREAIVGGSQETIDYRLNCGVIDLTYTDRVRDDTTSELYEVSWVAERHGLGMAHIAAGLRKVAGAA